MLTRRPALLRELSGQILISTHSPILAEISIRWIESASESGLTENELRKHGKTLFKQGNDALFAKLVILFEGDSERDALPIFAEAFWGSSGASGVGISLVSAGGAGTFKAIVAILENLGVPWLIFSDGDQAGQKAVRQVKKYLGIDENAPDSRITMLSTGDTGVDLEAYFARYFRSTVESVIVETYGESALDTLKQKHGKSYPKKKPEELRDYSNHGWEERLVRDFLHDKKPYWCRPVAQAMIRERDPQGRPLVPDEIRRLFDEANRILAVKS